MRERTSNLGDLKYVQIHDLDDSFNNSRVHCTYDLRLQIKQRGILLMVLNKGDESNGYYACMD